jgi:hypothetical protein
MAGRESARADEMAVPLDLVLTTSATGVARRLQHLLRGVEDPFHRSASVSPGPDELAELEFAVRSA